MDVRAQITGCEREPLSLYSGLLDCVARSNRLPVRCAQERSVLLHTSTQSTYNPGQNYVGQACRMHCLDHRSVFHMETNVLWAKFYLPPLPPCNVVRKERLAEESSNIASGGGKGGASEYCRNSGKRHSVSHILARIVVLFRATIRAKTVETELSEHNSYPPPPFRRNYA